MKSVFHVSDSDLVSVALGGVQNLLDDDSVEIDEIAVIANGKAVEKFIKGSSLEENIVNLLHQGVVIRVCSNSLKAFGVSEGDLIKDVEGVASGVGELTKLQNNGYAYIRI